MQNPKSDKYITWESALVIAQKEIYCAEKSGKMITKKDLKKYPSIVRDAIVYCLAK